MINADKYIQPPEPVIDKDAFNAASKGINGFYVDGVEAMPIRDLKKFLLAYLREVA